MSRVINPNFIALRSAMLEGKSGMALEGGSRSGKTWSGVDFLVYLCSRIEKKCTINIVKETYNSFKTTLYDDFNRRLPDFSIPSPFEGIQERSSFYLFGSKINLLGADKTASLKHGVSADYTWYNESLDISKPVFDQTEMRTRKFWWMDYNPKFTDHWIFDNVCKREDVGFLRTTMLDNPYISQQERKKILSYEDTPENRSNGTVDKYMWDVYGLGLRAARQGLIFPDVIWEDCFPENQDHVVYGMDFGYTNDPTCIGRCCVIGRDLYAECLTYAPTENYEILKPIYQTVVNPDCHCWADSADKEMISQFRQDGINVFGAIKYSVKAGIDVLKGYRIHLVRNDFVRKEQENYCWKEVNGILINEPEDKYNHFWDQLRYAVTMEYR